MSYYHPETLAGRTGPQADAELGCGKGQLAASQPAPDDAGCFGECWTALEPMVSSKSGPKPAAGEKEVGLIR